MEDTERIAEIREALTNEYMNHDSTLMSDVTFLLSQLDTAHEHIKIAESDNADLRKLYRAEVKENNRLREVLEWYGTPSQYALLNLDDYLAGEFATYPVMQDGGKHAREAIQPTEGREIDV